MSIPTAVIECSTCDYQVAAVQTHGAFSWCDDTGNRAQLTRELGVCEDCACVVAIEKLPSESELQDMVAEVRATHPRPMKKGFLSRLMGERKDDHPDWLKALDSMVPKNPESVLLALSEQKRRPLCLTCGSTNIAPLNLPQRDDLSETLEYTTRVKHPGCSGVLVAYFPRNQRFSPMEFATLVHVSGRIVSRHRYR